MTAYGRKRTLDFVDFRVSERPLWRKADISEYPQDFHKIDQHGMSAFRPEADIELELVQRSANDPKRTVKPIRVFLILPRAMESGQVDSGPGYQGQTRRKFCVQLCRSVF